MNAPLPLPSAAASGTPHPIETPEGVSLPFVVAGAGDRLVAFLLDLAAIFLAIALLAALLHTVGGRGDRASGWLAALVVLAAFLVQNAYFIAFELRSGGATPGKRRVGLRVMSADGGMLGADQVVTRNLMRNLEVDLPLALLLDPEALFPGAPLAIRLVASAWLVLFAVLPLTNRLRLRAGDMAAGTIVVRAPRAVLLRDLGAAGAAPPTHTPTHAPTYAFTEAQLDVYGIYELQVLEDVLRREVEDGRPVVAVADRIVRKLRYEQRVRPSEARAFLLAFYAALRGRLEGRLLLGHRKKDKHERSG